MSGFQIENKISGAVLKQILHFPSFYSHFLYLLKKGWSFWTKHLFRKQVLLCGTELFNLHRFIGRYRTEKKLFLVMVACMSNVLLWAEMVGQVIKHETDETTWWCWPTRPECSPAVSPCEQKGWGRPSNTDQRRNATWWCRPACPACPLAVPLVSRNGGQGHGGRTSWLRTDKAPRCPCSDPLPPVDYTPRPAWGVSSQTSTAVTIATIQWFISQPGGEGRGWVQWLQQQQPQPTGHYFMLQLWGVGAGVTDFNSCNNSNRTVMHHSA